MIWAGAGQASPTNPLHPFMECWAGLDSLSPARVSDSKPSLGLEISPNRCTCRQQDAFWQCSINPPRARARTGLEPPRRRLLRDCWPSMALKFRAQTGLLAGAVSAMDPLIFAPSMMDRSDPASPRDCPVRVVARPLSLAVTRAACAPATAGGLLAAGSSGRARPRADPR